MAARKALHSSFRRFNLRTKTTLATTTTALFSLRSISISSSTTSTPLNASTTHHLSNTSPSSSIRSASTSATPSTPSHHRVIILGSGPAGLTAALYAARANLSPLVLEGNEAGGQLTTTTDVENYPGFPNAVLGYDLIDAMKQQTMRFGTEFASEHVESVDLSQRPFVLQTANKRTYTADALIIASGASAKYLGLENEQRLIGRGVSACATCDGFFFKGADIAVVGGGDTACEEATFLTKFARRVFMIHRRDAFRASQIMRERVFANEKISVIWDTECVDVMGEDKVEGIKLRNVKSGEESVLDVSGLFLGIGHSPNTAWLNGSGVDLDEHGYVVVKKEEGTVETSVEGVFACGDVQDTRYKQAITAAGTGCMAAMDAEKFLEAQQHAKLD